MLNNLSPDAQDVIKRLPEIEAREKAATEGEWVRTGERGLTIVSFHGTSRKARCGTPICGMFPCTGSSIVDEHDAEFIIKAHTDVPALTKALCEVVKRLEATGNALTIAISALETARQAIVSMRSHHDDPVWLQERGLSLRSIASCIDDELARIELARGDASGKSEVKG